MYRFAHLLCFLLCLLISLPASSVQAATLTITSNADSGVGTLREAIATASSGDKIVFGNDMTIALSSGPLMVTTSITIDATGHVVVVDGSGISGVFQVNSSVIAAFTYLTIKNGRATSGGGIYNSGTLTLTNCTVSGNVALNAAGIFNYAGMLTLTYSTVSGNSNDPNGEGGGILNASGTVALINSTVSGNSGGLDGGGIFNDAGTLTLMNSTLSNNTASSQGGGIYSNIGFIGSVTVTNSTLSGNQTAGYGGGIFNYGPMALANTTLSGNFSSMGGAIYQDGGALTLINSTLADNTATLLGSAISNYTPYTTTNSIFSGDCAGFAGTDNGGNLESGISCGFSVATSKNNATLNLGPLMNNGGPTPTMLPSVGSMAIDAGIDSVCAAAPVRGLDQRGIPHPQGAHCDSGAVEVVVPQTLAVGIMGNGTVSAGAAPAPQSGGISNCTNAGGANCSAIYATGQSVVLTAVVPSGNNVTWGGACAAAGNATTATVTMSAAENCTATFALNIATTTLTSLSSTSTYGQPVTFIATMTMAASVNVQPTGTVAFLDGGSPIGTGTLTLGVATFTTNALSVGSHPITAQYGGDSNFLVSAPQPVSNTLTQAVNQASQTITFTSAPPPSPAVTDTYIVAATGGASGNPVTYSIDPNSTIGACTISGYIVSFTGTGNCIIDGNQAGNATYAAAPQATQTIVIGKSSSFVSLFTVINPSTYGQSVTFTAQILYYSDHGPQPAARTQTTSAIQANTPSLPVPTGTVTFTEGPIVLCNNVSVSSEAAYCPTSSLAVGNHTITAIYSGDSNFTSSTNTFVQVVSTSPTVVSASMFDRWAMILLGSLLSACVFWRLRRSDRPI